jgi:hypothetical protein
MYVYIMNSQKEILKRGEEKIIERLVLELCIRWVMGVTWRVQRSTLENVVTRALTAKSKKSLRLKFEGI